MRYSEYSTVLSYAYVEIMPKNSTSAAKCLRGKENWPIENNRVNQRGNAQLLISHRLSYATADISGLNGASIFQRLQKRRGKWNISSCKRGDFEKNKNLREGCRETRISPPVHLPVKYTLKICGSHFHQLFNAVIGANVINFSHIFTYFWQKSFIFRITAEKGFCKTLNLRKMANCSS